ncbi:MAG TPA: Rho termination factor N-terminal domain-containing protein [Solirubrobacteraceae bacterium]|nr:Rho termination factor N-terminal domain-containing protein [Solirubrobacteraceae bacterium]
MSIISPADLEASPLADLHALASALGIDGFRRLRKDDLIDAILARQGAAAPRRPRARRSAAAAPDTTDTAGVADVAEAEEEEGAAGPADERPARSSRSRRRRGGGRSRDGDEESPVGAPQASREESEAPSERIAEGVVELLANGSGFLRVNADEVSDDDVYISAAQARRCELVAGDRISGPVRAARRSERHASLIRIDTINGVPADEAVVGTRIDDIDVDFPSELFVFADDAALAALPPFGRGSRVAVVGPPRSGRSALLGLIAAALAGTDGLDVELLAVGVRPEELSEYKLLEHAVSSGLSFAASAETQESAVEQAAERGRRIALRGGNAVLLIDTLDGLGHGAARRAMAAARNLRGAGSLTVIATARAPLGGETTLITLLTTGEFPSLDESASGTLRPELLVAAAPAKPARVRKPRAPRKKVEAEPPTGAELPSDAASATDSGSVDGEDHLDL